MSKPNVLIFGGLPTCSRALAALLVSSAGESLVNHLRIVDKFSVMPPTTYLGAEFKKLLSSKTLEYKQANLTVPSVVSSCFEPPADQAPYDYVFDLTGELSHDRPEQVQISHTFNVARNVGHEASKRRVKAYVRLMQPYYETPEKGSHTEKVDIKPLKNIGTWWHESLRALAAIPDLNLVILRVGFVYGPYVNIGLATSTIVVASVYGHLQQQMKTLWSPGKNPVNTVHVEDVAGALWACAEWMKGVGRAEANSIAGEEIIFHNDKSKAKEVEGVCPPTEKAIAPLFNLVDDSQLTMRKAGDTVASFFGTTFGFLGTTTDLMAKVKWESTVEEVNEDHVGGWTEMITNSKPPVPNTPLSAYMDTYLLSKHSVALSNEKIKEIIGFKLRHPQFDHETIKEIVEKWKEEGSWPVMA